MATYVNDLRLKEIATGDESGTWGTSTNTNLELIAEAFSFGTEAITTNADTHTTTIADGSTDPGRSIFLKYTGTLDSACTITIGPNTVSKLWLIENATSGSQTIIIKQGSGATITVPNGQTKAIYSDGAGSGGAMVDAFQDLSIPDLFIDDDLTIGDDLVFSSDSAVITFGADGDTTLTHTDGSGLTLNSTNKIMFNDASQFIQGSSATVLSLGATDEIDLTATLIDINGNADVSGTVTATGTSVFASLDISGDIDVDGTTNLDVVDIDGALTQDGGAVFNEASADVDFRIESNGQENMFFVDGGDDAVVIGNNSSRKTLFNTTATAAFQIEGTSGNTAAMSIARNSNDDNGPQFVLAKSNGTSAGAVTVVTDDALLGRISFQGADGTQTVEGARVEAFVDGTPGADDMPGRLVFSTTADGASSPTVALTLDRNQDATFAAQLTIPEKIIHTGDTDTFLQFNAADTFRIVAGDEERFRVATGEVVVNESSVDTDFRVESNNNANMFVVDAGNDHINIGQNVDYGGVVNIASGDNSTQLVLVSTDTDSDFGPALSLYRASASSAADNDGLGQISLQGLNDANQATTYAQISANAADVSDGTEDGQLNIKTMKAGSLVNSLTFADSETTLNDSSIDVDFRVESDGNTHMLYVDAGNNAVGIGVSDPGGLPLHLKVASGDNKLRMETANKDAFVMELEDSSGNLKLGTNSTAGALEIVDAGGVIISVADNSDTLTLISTDGDAGSGPVFNLNRNSGSPNDGDDIGQIKFDGRNDAAQAVTYAKIAGNIADATDGTEDGALYFSAMSGGSEIQRMSLVETETVFNEQTRNIDFRIESDSSANAFVLDAGLDAIGIQTAAVSGVAVTIAGRCDATGYIFQNDSDTGIIRGAANQINLRTGGADNFIATSSQVTVPAGSASAPGLAFTGDSNTGINGANADNIGFTVGGSQKAFLSASQFNVTGNGVFSGSISKGSGSFKIDHPLPAKTDTHHLVHSFVEAPQADNIYRGSVDLVGGSATVNIDTAAGMTDGTFVLLNTNVQCFTSNESGWTAIKGSVSGNTLTITAQDNSCTDTISWMVVGERHDQHMKDTEWTDSDGKVIVEPEKTTEGE